MTVTRETTNLVATETQCAAKLILDSLDHALLVWTTEIANSGGMARPREIELYFQQVVETAISKAWYYRRMGCPGTTNEMLETVLGMVETLCKSRDPDTQHLCAKYFLTRGALRIDASQYDTAVEMHLRAVKNLDAEQRVRFGSLPYVLSGRSNPKAMYKMRRCYRFLIIAMHNIGLCYSVLGVEVGALDSYRTCSWCCSIEDRMFGSETRPLSEVLVQELLRDEQKRLETAEKVRADHVAAVVRQHHRIRTSLTQEEVHDYVNSLWKRSNAIPSDPRRDDDGEQWRSIMQSIRAPFKTRRGSEASAKSSPSPSLRTSRAPTASRSQRQSPRRTHTLATRSEAASPHGDKLLNPDEFFKARICRHMGIDQGWLEESDHKVRFRQNMIAEIRDSERNSAKAANILREYLMVKHRDKFPVPSTESNPMELARQVRNDINFKAMPLKSELNSRAVDSSPSRNLRIVTHRKALSTLPLTDRRRSTTVRTAPRDPKRAVVATAEELQKQIMELEHATGNESRTKRAPGRMRTASEIRQIREEQVERHQALVKSILSKAYNDRVVRSTVKFRPGIVAHGLSLIKIG